MPEAWLRTSWPDAREISYYSPSSTIRDHFVQGAAYDVAEFLGIARAAFAQASARVAQKYGFPCTRAAASLTAIERQAAAFAEQTDARVTILEITP